MAGRGPHPQGGTQTRANTTDTALPAGAATRYGARMIWPFRKTSKATREDHSRAAGFSLPESFAVASYDAVMDLMARYDPNAQEHVATKAAWHTYASGWNGISFRLRASSEYDSAFRKSIAGPSLTAQEERFRQERDLFGFFASALSAIECFYMAAYGVGAVMKSPSFPLASTGHLRRDHMSVAGALQADFSGTQLAARALEVSRSPELGELADMRNFLAHRGILPRTHFRGLGTGYVDPPTALPSNPTSLASEFLYTGDLSENTTRRPFEWTVETITGLVEGLYGFLRDDAPTSR